MDKAHYRELRPAAILDELDSGGVHRIFGRGFPVRKFEGKCRIRDHCTLQNVDHKQLQ